mmetsp:Transcript_23850/g.55636  ORF Transcript_23850/g.55636 Transcript_23850/m.55636 type:complete len:155 (+) Transcript_23850:40-504(+)
MMMKFVLLSQCLLFSQGWVRDNIHPKLSGMGCNSSPLRLSVWDDIEGVEVDLQRASQQLLPHHHRQQQHHHYQRQLDDPPSYHIIEEGLLKHQDFFETVAMPSWSSSYECTSEEECSEEECVIPEDMKRLPEGEDVAVDDVMNFLGIQRAKPLA